MQPIAPPTRTQMSDWTSTSTRLSILTLLPLGRVLTVLLNRIAMLMTCVIHAVGEQLSYIDLACHLDLAYALAVPRPVPG